MFPCLPQKVYFFIQSLVIQLMAEGFFLSYEFYPVFLENDVLQKLKIFSPDENDLFDFLGEVRVPDWIIFNQIDHQ